MTSQVINIERRKYATGLFWQPVAGGQNARVLARNLSKFIPGHTGKYFMEYRSMVGVGGRAMGHRRRMPSAAAEVMEAFADYNSFLAAFAVRQGFYIVAARNGIIIQDRLIPDEASAKEVYEQFAGLPDWGRIVAPGHWDIPRSEEGVISETVSGEARYYLAPISKLGGIVFSAVIIIALFIGIFYVFREPIMNMTKARRIAAIDAEAAEAKREEQRRKMEERDTMLTAARIVPAIAPARVVMPYDNIPDLVQRAEQCHEAMVSLMQIIPGWTQVDVECGDGYATAHLHRRFGVITDVYTIVADRMHGVEITENSDSDLTLVLELDELPGQSRMSEQDVETAVRNINSAFQRMGHAAAVRRSVETVRGGGTTAVDVVLVSAASAMQPREFVEIFADYDGAVLSSVRWNAASRKWNYEVKIYVKQP